MSTHVFLVAVAIEGDLTREEAEIALARTLPRPNIDGAWVGDARDPKKAEVECWWIAEDDRRDGSDNDSAVFVTPGFQQAAYDLLHENGMTPDCNDPRKQGGRTPHFEGPGVTYGIEFSNCEEERHGTADCENVESETLVRVEGFLTLEEAQGFASDVLCDASTPDDLFYSAGSWPDRIQISPMWATGQREECRHTPLRDAVIFNDTTTEAVEGSHDEVLG